MTLDKIISANDSLLLLEFREEDRRADGRELQEILERMKEENVVNLSPPSSMYYNNPNSMW